MWAIQHLASIDWMLGLHSLVGVAILLGVFHAVVGRSETAFTAVLISLTMISVMGTTKFFTVFGQDIVGGSIAFPVLFGVMSLCSFELKHEEAHRVMLAVLASIGLMTIVQLHWAFYEILSPEPASLAQQDIVLLFTVLFFHATMVYYVMNSRLMLIRCRLMCTLPMRYVYVLATDASCTIMQVVTFHLDHIKEEPEMLLWTVLLRLSVSGCVGVTYWVRFNGNPPTARKLNEKS